MDKKKTRKSGSTRTVRDLPLKTLTARSVKGAKSGFGDISITHSMDKSSPVLFDSSTSPKK